MRPALLRLQELSIESQKVALGQLDLTKLSIIFTELSNAQNERYLTLDDVMGIVQKLISEIDNLWYQAGPIASNKASCAAGLNAFLKTYQESR